MKAVVRESYGPPEVLQLQEVPTPIPKKNELLVKIMATTVTAGDCELRRFDIATWIWLPLRLYMGIFKPRIKILGQELAGKIVAVGEKVTTFKIGDEIFASTGIKMGGYAQYTCLSEKQVIGIKPINAAYEEVATIPAGGINGIHFLRKAKVQKGHQILINGAGGSIGTYAVQIAKLWGAEVTVVDSTQKLEMLKSIGADHLIDYTQEDFTKTALKYDSIIDIVGTSSYNNCLKSLKTKGVYILGNPGFRGILRSVWTSLVSSKKVSAAMAIENMEDYTYLKELIATKKIKVIIDKRYPLEELVAAHHYVEKGLKAGHLIINLAHQ